MTKTIADRNRKRIKRTEILPKVKTKTQCTGAGYPSDSEKKAVHQSERMGLPIVCGFNPLKQNLRKMSTTHHGPDSEDAERGPPTNIAMVIVHAHGEGDKDEIRKAVIRLIVRLWDFCWRRFSPRAAETVALALYVTRVPGCGL